MIKCKIRNNSIYPLLFLLFNFLRKGAEILIKDVFGFKTNLLMPILIFISQVGGGIIKIIISKKFKKQKYIIPQRGIKLIGKKPKITYADSKIKIVILIILASYFNYFGVMIRNGKKPEKINDFYKIDTTVESRLRNIQIIISAFLCFFCLRIKIYKHQILSLIIIMICLIGLIFIEFFGLKMTERKIESVFLSFLSCFARSFLDTTEKYLLEFDYIDPFKILLYEGLISFIFNIFSFYFGINDYKEEILGYNNNNKYSAYVLIPFLIFYTIFSAFRNIYRLYTNKIYSPTARAFIESVIDPIIFLYNFWKVGLLKNYLESFIFIIILLIIIGFFSLIYNEFIVLYCFGLERNTHSEIAERAYLQDLDGELFDEDEEDDDNKSEEKNKMLELRNDYN